MENKKIKKIYKEWLGSNLDTAELAKKYKMSTDYITGLISGFHAGEMAGLEEVITLYRKIHNQRL